MSRLVFTPFPILTTERLTLRQLVLNDAQDIFALRSDGEINKYLARHIEAFAHKNNQNSTKLLEKLEFKKPLEPDKTNPDYYVFRFEAHKNVRKKSIKDQTVSKHNLT